MRIRNERTRIGGPSVSEQIDETAFCRRRLIYHPTSERPVLRHTKWVIGAICERSKKVRLKVLDDRKIESISEFIRENILPGTVIKTDGYPTYPEIIRLNNCSHIVVNHSNVFINEDEEHTNTIESVWSSVKIEIRSRRGVMFNSLESFIKEYEQLKEHINENNYLFCNEYFIKLIKQFFNY